MVNGVLVGDSWSDTNTRSKIARFGDTLVHLPLDPEDNDRVTYKCYLYYKVHSQVKLLTGFVKATFHNQIQYPMDSEGRDKEEIVSLNAFPSWPSIPIGLQELTLFCLSETSPSDLILWSFNGKLLESVSTLKEDKHYVSERSMLTGRLRLINIKNVHAGRWSCEVQASERSYKKQTPRSATYQLNVIGESFQYRIKEV